MEQKGAQGWRDIVAAAKRFGTVGVFCALLNIGLVFGAVEWAGLHYGFGLLATFVITIPLSYLLHRAVTYDLSHPLSWSEYARFLGAQSTQFAIGALGMVGLVEVLNVGPIAAMLVVSAASFVFGFLLSATWVFSWLGPRRPDERTDASQGQKEFLRILQVSAFFPAHGGGIEVVAGHLAQGLASNGVLVHWMAGGETAEKPQMRMSEQVLVDQAVSVNPLEAWLGLPSPLWTIRSLRRLWAGVRSADLVHVHDYLYCPTLMAIGFARVLGRPLVITQHIGTISFSSRFWRAILAVLNRTLGAWALASAEQVAFVGQPVRAYFEQRLRFKTPPLLIPNGVDHELFRPQPVIAEAGADPVRLLFVGRFVEKKGLHLIRNCLDLPGCHWIFVGWGPISPDSWPERRENVQVVGRLSSSEIVAYYQQADLLVLPSCGEGFPLVVQEALACGTPVLVSREVAEAFPETDPQCVFDVELRADRPEEALRQRLIGLTSDRVGLARAREPAARLAAQWSWERCVNRYIEVYRGILAGRREEHSGSVPWNPRNR